MVMNVTRRDLDRIKQVQLMPRTDWPAVFSTNGDDIWPQAVRGWTPFESRLQVRGLLEFLDTIADIYLEVRPEGGRFFIDSTGAFYKDEAANLNLPPFVVFRHRC